MAQHPLRVQREDEVVDAVPLQILPIAVLVDAVQKAEVDVVGAKLLHLPIECAADLV